MIKKGFIFLLFFPHLLLSQEGKTVVQDSIGINDLEEVVITGQINPQSVKKSVFEVTVINRETIEQQAGNNLADVLNQTLNINIIPNASTGKSGVQLFGLDAQYFKILVDNVPIINDEGLGNNTDLTQINLDDIERVEIVEGAMGVQYGANAVSGIINIITKKSSQHRWEITPYIQEETVGNEYNLTDKGRHIQSLKVGHNFSEKLYANAMYTRNDFKGFFNGKKGKDYTENDGLRGYEWLPKEQQTLKALLNYGSDNFRLLYKFEFFDETVERYDASVRTNYNPATQTSNPTASDEIFTSTRLYNHLNVFGKIRQRITYDISASYQEQSRDVETFTYRINQRRKENVDKQEYESRKGYFSRGTFSNFLKSDVFNFQLGYEFSKIDGYASPLAGSYEETVARSLGSYDGFVSAEIHPNTKLSFRPGVRLLFSPQFQPLTAVSLSTKYRFQNGIEARAIVGSSPRLPSYEELYSYFVDVNHDVRGNENLQPEQGVSAFLHLKKNYWFNDYSTKLSTKLSSWYLSVDNRIELTIIDTSPLAYQFNNIDQFRSWGISTTNSIDYKNLQFSLGASFTGVSKVLDSQDLANDDFLYALQLNSSASYRIPKWNTVISTYFKYNGPQYLFVQKQDANNETILVRGKQDGFSWMDASVKKNFIDDALQVTLGVRNLMNINRINTTALEGGAHSGPPSSILLGYGRSYFLKLLYNLNF